MGDPWHYCEWYAEFYPPTQPVWFTQIDGEIVMLCEDCYRSD